MATPNSKPSQVSVVVDRRYDLPGVARKLERQYPGVRCKVEFNEFAPGKEHMLRYLPGHAAWTVIFFAESLECLVKHGLATAEQFEVTATLAGIKADRHPSMWNGFGDPIGVCNSGPKSWEVRTYVHDYQNGERYLTKKLAAQTARLLRPFVRGTWKPTSPASS